MGSYFEFNLPQNCTIVAYGDTHVGAKGFAEDAFTEHIVNRIRKSKNTYAIHMGDVTESVTVNHPHFQLDAVNIPRPLEQNQHFADLIEPVADKHLWVNRGNHDKRNNKQGDFLSHTLSRLDINVGSAQTWADLGNGVKLHAFHGRSNPPTGGQDPLKRVGSIHRWFVNKLGPLAGDVHANLMGHTHKTMYFAPPSQYIHDYTMNVDSNRTVDIVEMPVKADRGDIVHPYDRWYFNTGTYRRGGYWDGVDDDYAEEAGFAPLPIGHVEFTIKNGVIDSAKKVHPDLV